MPIEQWGRPIPDYATNHLYQNPQFYRDELLRQKEAMEYRLSEFDRQYPPRPIPQEPFNSSAAQLPPNKPSKPLYVAVTNEKEARDYPIVNKMDDEIGNVHFFVMVDESAIFAKRINPSTFEMEFEIYDRRLSTINSSDGVANSNNKEEGLLTNIDSRLERIEQFIDNSLSLFLSSNPSKSRTVKNAKPSDSVPPITSESEGS